MPFLVYIVFAVASTLAHASQPQPACTLDLLLREPGQHTACLNAYLKAIPDAQDRAEARHLMKTFRMPKDMHVIAQGDVLRIIQSQRQIARVVWLQRAEPSILWLNGDILTDTSNNPSLARRLDRMFKARGQRSSLNFSLLPQAHATAMPKDVVHTLTFLYSAAGERFSDATHLVSSGPDETLRQFLPARTPLAAWLGGPQPVRCATDNLVAPSQLDLAEPGYGVGSKVTITPLSPSRFLLKGYGGRGKTHLLKLDHQMLPTTLLLRPHVSGSSVQVHECKDPACREVHSETTLAQAGGRPDGAQGVERLINHTFGLSVMGSCCADRVCRERLQARFNIQLEPATGSAPQNASETAR